VAKESVVQGATSQSVNVFLQNSSSTTGSGLTGLVYNTSGLLCYYTWTGANCGSVAVTLATLSAVGSAYSSGGFKEIDSTNMPGLYRFDIPNAALAASKGQTVTFYFSGAANLAPCLLEIELTVVNNQSAGFGLVDASANVVQIAGSAVSATTAQLGVNVVNWNNTVVATPATAGIPDINVKNIAGTASAGTAGYTAPDWAHISAPTTTVDLSGTTIKNVDNAIATVTTVTNQLTAAQIATGVWQDTTAGDFTTSASVGKSVMNGVALGTGLTINGYTGNTPQTGDSYARLGAPAGASVSADVAVITGIQSIRRNTAQAGSATTITLDSGASATNNYYINDLIVLTGGTGAGQSRFISGYVGSTKIATVATWATNPDVTSTFAIVPFDAIAGAVAPTVAQIATGVWTDTTAADFTTALSIGKSVLNGVSLGTGLTINGYTGNTPQTGDAYARLGAPAGASVSADIAAVEVNALAAKTSTAGLTYTVTNQVDVNVKSLAGTASAGAAGYVGVDWGHVNAPTTTVGLSGTTIATSQVVASVSGAVGSVTGAVGSVTGSVGSVVGNTDQTGDVYGLLTGANTELAAVPASTATIIAMIKWLFLLARNQITQSTSSTVVQANSAGATVGTATVADSGSVFTRGQFS
jgi:hypothetical protein